VKQYHRRQDKIMKSWKSYNTEAYDSSENNLKQGITLEAGETV
jgi:hypothetical protein